jgi:hypothetical protein
VEEAQDAEDGDKLSSSFRGARLPAGEATRNPSFPRFKDYEGILTSFGMTTQSAFVANCEAVTNKHSYIAARFHNVY